MKFIISFFFSNTVGDARRYKQGDVGRECEFQAILDCRRARLLAPSHDERAVRAIAGRACALRSQFFGTRTQHHAVLSMLALIIAPLWNGVAKERRTAVSHLVGTNKRMIYIYIFIFSKRVQKNNLKTLCYRFIFGRFFSSRLRRFEREASSTAIGQVQRDRVDQRRSCWRGCVAADVEPPPSRRRRHARPAVARSDGQALRRTTLGYDQRTFCLSSFI